MKPWFFGFKNPVTPFYLFNFQVFKFTKSLPPLLLVQIAFLHFGNAPSTSLMGAHVCGRSIWLFSEMLKWYVFIGGYKVTGFRMYSPKALALDVLNAKFLAFNTIRALALVVLNAQILA